MCPNSQRTASRMWYIIGSFISLLTEKFVMIDLPTDRVQLRRFQQYSVQNLAKLHQQIKEMGFTSEVCEKSFYVLADMLKCYHLLLTVAFLERDLVEDDLDKIMRDLDFVDFTTLD